MGIFDKLMGAEDVKLTPKSALALAAMTIIGADGVIENDELASLSRIVRGDQDSFDSAFKLYKDLSFEKCVSLVSSTLDQKQKIALIAILLDIAMADGILAGTEKNLLELYIGSFQISEDIIKSIVEVIALKNDFSIFE
jgi:uncharacterized tellurite resistance protein B-like protein